FAHCLLLAKVPGSGVIKAGFAGDQIPKYFVSWRAALEGVTLFIGPNTRSSHGLQTSPTPAEAFMYHTWDTQEGLLFWAWGGNLKKLSTFCSGVSCDSLPFCFSYATGRTTGVVLDSGDGVTHAVPIYEGFAMPHSIMRIDIAGRDVSRFLRLYLRKEGYDFHSSSEFEIVKAIKERACYLSINPQKDETLETEKAQYYLPDGSTIEIGPSRFRAPELLFRPDLIGEESEGIHEVLVFAIQKSDMDLRRTLFSNIVLSGGSTLFKGFGDRLLSEVKKLAPKDVKIRISAPQERLYSTWIGGSILASLDTFKKMWVSKKEYEEDGARSIHRKTF
uniref:Actin related protein 1A n=1 Tax=Aotus nancymaae TaxID=37293 RepID=A0A2K5EH97_AOTNA